MGIPEIDPTSQEPAVEMAKLFICLFNSIGANVILNNIDTAHRVPIGNAALNGPKPIICKFGLGIAQKEFMSHHRQITEVDLTAMDLDRDLLNAMILDHLKSNEQKFLFEAKKFKTRFSYASSWARNQVIYLWQSENSQPIRVKDLGVLQRMAQEKSHT